MTQQAAATADTEGAGAPRKDPKQALKELRQARGEHIAAAKAAMKEQSQEVGRIKKALAQGPLTVPELAEAAGMEPSRAMYYVATLMKYGQLREQGRDGRYFRYGLVPKTEPREKAQTDGC